MMFTTKSQRNDIMIIRRATASDIKKIKDLLNQVLDVHHNARPDLFKANCRKYNDNELKEIIFDNSTPVFVADENGEVLGYAFCIFVCHENNNILTDIKTLYIDDLCVDSTVRGKGIGKALYDFAVDVAKKNDCYNITLNVWSCNDDALRFYEKCGLKPQKIGMEMILSNK